MKFSLSLQTLKLLDRKFLINVGIRYAAVLLFLFLVLFPSCSVLNSLRNKASDEKNQLARTRTKIADALRMQKNQNAFRNEIRKGEERLFTEDELSQLISIISDLAKSQNLQMTASKPIQETDKILPSVPPPPKAGARAPNAPDANSLKTSPRSFYTDQKFEVELLGDYHSLGRFLSALRKNPKLIHVKKLEIISLPASPFEHEIKLSVAVYLKNR